MKKNVVRGEDANLSKDDFDVAVWRILTDEELMIAGETKKYFLLSSN